MSMKKIVRILGNKRVMLDTGWDEFVEGGE
jgi:hypothetical protein